MKKTLDKIWEWMKSTAWFQVVLLVGVLVGIVLCISPITTGIKNAISNADRAKYYENNKVNYDDVIEKIDSVDENGFAVMFVKANTASTYEKGIQNYEATDGAKKIYVFNTDVSDSTKDSYNQDEKWFEHYKVNYEMMLSVKEACSDVYDLWKDDSLRSSDYVIKQTSDFTTASGAISNTPSDLIPTLTLVWFRSTSKIDKDVIKAQANSINHVTGQAYNFHIAKVYTSFVDSSSSSNTDSNVMSGLFKFFSPYADSLDNADNFGA